MNESTSARMYIASTGRYKAELTIPTEQFGNIRPIVEGTVDEIIEAYWEFSNAFKDKEGLNVKDWQKALDDYLNLGTMNSDMYDSMSLKQQGLIQEIKKSLKRIKSKE